MGWKLGSAAVLLASLSLGPVSWAAAPGNLPDCSDTGAIASPANLLSREALRLPAVGETSTADIGRSMIAAARYSVYGGQIELLDPIAFDGPPAQAFKGPSPVPPRPEHRFRIDVPAGLYNWKAEMSAANPVPAYVVTGLEPTAADGRVYHNGAVGFELAGDGKVTLVFGYPRAMWRSPPLPTRYRKVSCAAWTQGDFRRELIYGGLAAGVISISYREYSDGFARPAFTQDLRYDLKDGREIGFQGAPV